MNQPDRSDAGREPLAIDLLLTTDQRRPVSVAGHHEWRESLTPDSRYDEIDRELDDMIVVDPYEVHGPSRRSDKSLGAFLNLIDSLPTGNDRKETTR